MEKGTTSTPHGAVSPWPYSLSWLDKFADPALAKQLYTAPFPLGIVEHLTTIMLSRYANDRQLKTLFNYLIHSGKALHLGKFIREVAQRVPQHKEKLMTISLAILDQGSARKTH
jgi:predicted transposase YdaD